jgi:hypothetical protein
MEHGKGQQEDRRFRRELLKRSYEPNWKSSDPFMAIDLNPHCALDSPVEEELCYERTENS